MRLAHRLPYPLAVAAACLTMARPAPAQELDRSAGDRALATRPALEALAKQLEQAGPGSGRDSLLSRVRARLKDGDFRPGDLVLVEVQAESTLTDTFSVSPGPALRLPAPTVGSLALAGVLRAELEPKLTEYVSQFVTNAVVRARPLIRLSVQGEVVRSGIYGVPADAMVSDALMAAGGQTQRANMRKLRVERAGKPLWEGDQIPRALAAGRTIDEVGLRDGDQIVVGERRSGFRDNLNFLWVVVSLTGGIYGLSRAF